MPYATCKRLTHRGCKVADVGVSHHWALPPRHLPGSRLPARFLASTSLKCYVAERGRKALSDPWPLLAVVAEYSGCMPGSKRATLRASQISKSRGLPFPSTFHRWARHHRSTNACPMLPDRAEPAENGLNLTQRQPAPQGCWRHRQDCSILHS